MLYPPLVNGLQKTLDAQLDEGVTSSVTLNNTTNIQNLPGVFVVSRVDANGNLLPTSQREYVKYTAVSGNTLTGLVRGTGGSTDQDHAVGSIVEFVSDVQQQQEIIDAIDALETDFVVEHNADGTHSDITANSTQTDSLTLASGATVTTVLDEDDMSSDSATALVTQQSIKAYVDNNPYGGWITAGLSGVTVTRHSTDDPTVVLRFNADVTDYIWQGMRIKVTENSIVHYFKVTVDPVYSAPNTDVTCLSEIDTTTPTQAKNLIGTGTISDVAYAPPKTYPKGFPISDESWAMEYVSTSLVNETSPSQDTWVNPGSMSFDIHPGLWSYGYKAAINGVATGTDSFVSAFGTLSTTNNGETDSDFTSNFFVRATKGTSNELRVGGTVSLFKVGYFSTKTTLYLNGKLSSAGTPTSIEFRGERAKTVIRATLAY